MNILRKKMTGVSAVAVSALVVALLAPSAAMAAEGDEAPATTESSVVESADAQAIADAAAKAVADAAAAEQAATEKAAADAAAVKAAADAAAAEQAAAALAASEAAAQANAATAPTPESPAPVADTTVVTDQPVQDAAQSDESAARVVAPVAPDKTNDVKYWEALYPEHQAQCYKSDGNSGHGSVTNDGKAVTLVAYDQSWPGDHWEVLIVKGGSVDSGDGPGNAVYEHPTAGQAYFTPVNAGGKQPNVSHWIVCKGTTPVQPVVKQEVGLFIYPLTDATKAPSWENSGKQTFCDSKPGTDWFTSVTCTLPPEVCGPGWGYQQDKVKDWKYDGAFNWPANVQYPVDNIGWPPIYAAQHGLLSDLVTVPDCTPPPTPKVCTTLETGPTATDVAPAGWNTHDTRATGVSEFVDGGYHLQTTDTANPGSSQNKATLYRSVTPTPLAEFGEPSVEFAAGGSGVKPGMQVGIDVDGDGDWDGYLVGEPWSYGAHNWWINKPGFNVPSGNGYTSFGSWADFVAANPAAMVIENGLSMGSGVVGDWTVTSFTAGCVVYTFDKYTPPVVAPASLEVSVVVTCGTATITADNTIEDLKPGQTAADGELTYTDAAGVTQTVSVPMNTIKVITVTFPEDSGSHIVTAGVKGEVQNEYTVETNCVTDTYPITPKGAYFHDSCGTADDSYGIEDATKIPGSDETLVVDGVTYTLSAYTANDLSGTYYVNDYTEGDRKVFIAFVPFDRNAVITQPGEDDTYTIGDENVAVWEYTFSSEPCESTPPPTSTPTPPKPNTPTTPPAAIKPTGGIDTGLFGSDPSTPAGGLNPFGLSALAIMLTLAAAAAIVIVRNRRKAATDVAGE